MDRLSHIIRVALASLFLLASALKVSNIGEFRLSLARFALFPESWENCLAYVVVGTEFVVAGLLTFSSTVRWGAWLSALLFSSFAAFTGAALVEEGSFYCGCFPGSGWGRIGYSLFLLDLAGLGASTFLIVHCRKGKLEPDISSLSFES